ncbi:unnamed protein product [Ambrosiozyma monospora]|uniref:Unnamed protein product n=1 Tax=Ambrosiozyma monospora TaxID=43982 RepID=A0ACB5TKB0_AMBMO|nr:unnamed protein product [Ambrosiozyma monospora]
MDLSRLVTINNSAERDNKQENVTNPQLESDSTDYEPEPSQISELATFQNTSIQEKIETWTKEKNSTHHQSWCWWFFRSITGEEDERNMEYDRRQYYTL